MNTLRDGLRITRCKRRGPCLRGVAVGGENHYGSPWAEALIHSRIESSKLAGAEPRAYLSEAARRVIRAPGTVTLTPNLK